MWENPIKLVWHWTMTVDGVMTALFWTLILCALPIKPEEAHRSNIDNQSKCWLIYSCSTHRQFFDSTKYK